MKTRMLVPIDFNSLSRLENGKIALTDYYVDYAFHSEGITPIDGMKITFYDEHWVPKPNDVICFDATLRKNTVASDPWFAELQGRVYASADKPIRKYLSPCVGAGTRRLGENGAQTVEQKLGKDPAKNKLSGISCFVFADGSLLPDFSDIVGMDTKELHDFFQFVGFAKPQLENGRYPDDALVVRGGSNTWT
jgi:hypothetical protein